MKLTFRRTLFSVLFFILSVFAFSSDEGNLYYRAEGKIFNYNTYLQGTVEEKGEIKTIHLQFKRNWQLTKTKNGKYLLQEWSQKYQGSDFNFEELGLPRPEMRVEKIIDRLGRVEKVSRYAPGHRYYLNLLVFPDHPISLGTSWKYQQQINFELKEKNLPSLCQVIYQLDKILEYKEHHCGKILVNGSCQGGSPGKAMLDYRFQGKVFFDLEAGREIDYQLTYSWQKIDPEQNFKQSAHLELYSLLEK